LVETPKENILEEAKQDESDEIEDVLQRKIEALEKSEVKDAPLSGEIKPNSQVKFVPPKMEILEPEQKQKPVFIKTEEAKVPQPSQLAKKPQPIFESAKQNNNSEIKTEDKPASDKTSAGEAKTGYDDMFGNGIV